MSSERVPLNKIDDNTWQIPKTYKDCMRVPGVIYVDEDLLEHVKQDLTLEQLANVACLPGVLKHALAMPDAHQGYGFPIGGVAATDYSTGVISPGGVGYDINCLSPDSRILSENGYWIRLGELAGRASVERIKIYNDIEGHNDSTKILFISKRGVGDGETAVKVKTQGGRVIEGSLDHPVLTSKGYKPLKEIREGDYLIVNPFEGVEYADNDSAILDEGDFREHGKLVVKYLKEKGLIPLKTGDSKTGVLARLLGYALGKGFIVESESSRPRYTLYIRILESDIEELLKDLEGLKVKYSIIHSKRRCVKTGESKLRELTVKVSSNSFSLLLNKLGLPIKQGTREEFKIPGWVLNSPLWVKRNFLAGLYGAHGSLIHFKSSKPLPISFTVSKRRGLEPVLLDFLENIQIILEEFNVKSLIRLVKSSSNIVAYNLIIEDERSIRNFLARINYEYSRVKKQEGLIALEYLKRKEFSFKTQSDLKPVYSEIKNVKKSTGGSLPSFREFRSRFSLKGGFILDRVMEAQLVKPVYSEFYDLGVLHPCHNFIADGVVVHNCGVRVVSTNLKVDDVKPKISELIDLLFREIPSGLASKGKIRVSVGELNDVIAGGAKWAVEHGYGWSEDLKHCEENGCMKTADPDMISPKAKERGKSQIGSLGSGNHFLEVQYVERIFNPQVAKRFGIREVGQVLVMIHTGSRGLGHETCSDYLRLMETAVRKYNLKLPDRELACAPNNSEEAEKYFKAMSGAANFAWCNRQLITHWTRESFKQVFKTDPEDLEMNIIYDVAHNIAKLEEHEVDGKRVKCYVHRKGATRAFPPGHPDIPADYRDTGQPVILPGTMGTSSYILVGTVKAMEVSFGSTAHGAGRVLSRIKAVKSFSAHDVKSKLSSKNIMIRAADLKVISEEAPEAYKDIDRVAKISNAVGIATLVAQMKPLAVSKG